MTCKRCGHPNPQGSHFCEECGAALEPSCPSCGASCSPKAKFCRECGEALGGPTRPASPEREPRDYTPKHLADKILQSKSALEGERKQVTVLFADVKGSLELAEQVDAEEWHAVLDRFFQILAEGIHRFEGTVNQYTGDGVMALFGAPVAHEDHAQRACYAALHLRDELRHYAREVKRQHGLAFSVRIGLNSGDVVVGKIGDDLRMDYTAQGHTVGLAARMQELAEPGDVYLSQHTAALVSGYFELEDLGAFSVKGASDPVPVFLLEGTGPMRTRFDVSRARGLTRFVGRGDDMRTLESALASGLEGQGQVVGVVGEAGVGKSRLCFEFAERCRARGLLVLEGRAVAHGRQIPFLPVLQVFRAYFDISELDSERAAREKIAGRMLLLDEAFREVLPVLFEFLGVPDPERPVPRIDPDARQRQLSAVVRRLLETSDRGEGFLILIEDLHWLDGGSETFLEQWVEAITEQRGLLLLNFRPEYHAAWMQRSYFHQAALLPLGPEAVAELLDDLLGSDPSVTGLAQRIHAATGGNPFFTEEVIQSLIESGSLEGTRGRYRLVAPLEKLQVPASVQALLAARIDRLAEREKQVLQTAAVIGREFPEPILEQVAGLPRQDLTDALAALKTAEFVHEQALYPTTEYAFKHPLTHEVALGSQLGARRRRIHAAVAWAIEALEAEKLDERAALIAHHWEQAEEHLEAARWHRRAARYAGFNDVSQAHGHWQSVCSLLERCAEGRESASLAMEARTRILQLAWRLDVSDEEASKLLREGRSVAEATDDLRSLASLLSSYGHFKHMTGDLSAGLRWIEEAAALAERLGDPRLKINVALDRLMAYLGGKPIPETLRVAEEAISLFETIPQAEHRASWFDPCLMLRQARAWALARSGDIAGAERELDQMLEIGREKDALENLAYIHNVCTEVKLQKGEPTPALAHAKSAMELAERVASPFARSRASLSWGLALAGNQRWSEAREVLEQSLGLIRSRRVSLHTEPMLLLHLADACLAHGELERARSTALEAIASARSRGHRFFAAECQLALARSLRALGGAAAQEAVEQALADAQKHAEEIQNAAVVPLIHEERAELARLLEDEATADHELREAHRLYTEMGATGHAQRLAKELGL